MPTVAAGKETGKVNGGWRSRGSPPIKTALGSLCRGSIIGSMTVPVSD